MRRRFTGTGSERSVATGFDGINVVVLSHTGTGRDKFTDDDVFLKTDKRIDLVLDCGFGKHARGFLEGRCGQEAVGCERRFGDTEQGELTHCGSAAFLNGFEVGFVERVAVHHFAGRSSVSPLFSTRTFLSILWTMISICLSRDIDALSAVDRLHFLNDVFLHFLVTFGLQYVVRIDRTFGERIAGVDGCAPY